MTVAALAFATLGVAAAVVVRLRARQPAPVPRARLISLVRIVRDRPFDWERDA